MNIKDIFEKATSENKSLTYAEFEALAKEGKAKFTDLSEGRYVDKQKYEDDLASKDTQISGLNDTITSRDTDLASLKEQLANAGSDATKLEELTKNLTDLQAKYEADTTSLQEKLSAQSYEFAVRDFANKQKFSSNAARRDFVSSMLQKKLPMEGNAIMGADDYMKAYAKENADAFVKAGPKQTGDPKPQFAGTTPGNGEPGGKKLSLSEMMQRANDDPNYVVSFD